MLPEILRRIQDAVRDGRFRFSEHSLDELDADHLHFTDAESSLLTGQIVREQPDGPSEPGPRYTVVGYATDQATRVGVAAASCRSTGC